MKPPSRRKTWRRIALVAFLPACFMFWFVTAPASMAMPVLEFGHVPQTPNQVLSQGDRDVVRRILGRGFGHGFRLNRPDFSGERNGTSGAFISEHRRRSVLLAGNWAPAGRFPNPKGSSG